MNYVDSKRFREINLTFTVEPENGNVFISYFKRKFYKKLIMCTSELSSKTQRVIKQIKVYDERNRDSSGQQTDIKRCVWGTVKRANVMQTICV